MTSTRPLRTALGAGLAALALTLAACGGDDDTDGAGETTEAAAAETTEATEPTAAGADTTATGDTVATDATTAGSSAGPADRDAYVAAGMVSLGSIGDAGECVVESVVDGVGVDTLNEAGLTPETLWAPGAPLAEAGLTADSPELTAVADGIAGCDGLMESFAASAGETVTDEQLSCMEDGGAEELVGELLALSLIGADTTELDEQGQTLGDECGLGD